jgi:hypothetical protein
MAKDIVMLHGANAGGWCFEHRVREFRLDVSYARLDRARQRRRCKPSKITAFSYGHF